MTLISHTSVDGYFFDELKEYVGFDKRVEQLLVECAETVEPHYEAVVGSFYEALETSPRTRAVFEDQAQIERLHQTLLEWLDSAFRGPWDIPYFTRRKRIGRVHVEVGLLPHFMSGAMNVVRRHLIRVLVDNDGGIEKIEAVERLLDLELAILHQSYWDHMMELKLAVPVALASGLAHEIRNPLNAIGLNLKILERRLNATDASDSMPIVESVRGEVRRITDLTREIMDFARPVDVNSVWHRSDLFLQDIETMHSASFEAAGVTLETEARGDLYCYCDIDRMRQAIVNLLTNAVEAVDAGGKVRIEVESVGSITSLSVSDTGHGMNPALRYRIFDLFYTQKASGTGLGLPIVKHIVDAHGGTIEVQSKPGEGTTFTIRIPRPSNPPEGT